MKICIDPGHGGADPGAVSADGVHESDVVLDIARRVRHYLGGAGHEVQLTRTSDLATSLESRAKFANEWGAAAFISIHANAAEAASARGFEVWTSPGQTNGDKLADCIFDAVRDEFPLMVWRYDLSDGDRDKESRFFVLVRSRMPAALIEIGFMSNVDDIEGMSRPEWRARMAVAIGDGIIAYAS